MEAQRIRLGKRGPNWRGGKYHVESVDTTFVHAPNHPRAKPHNGAVAEHILNAEEHLGRSLTKTEIVHHLDRNRRDNRWQNLCVMQNSQHKRLHAALGRAGIHLILSGENSLVMEALEKDPSQHLVDAVYIKRIFCVSNL